MLLNQSHELESSEKELEKLVRDVLLSLKNKIKIDGLE